MAVRPKLIGRVPIPLLFHLRHTTPALRREHRVRAQAQCDQDLLSQLVRERLRAIVKHAHRWVPFYRERYDPALVASFRGIEDLPRLPVIGRRDVQRSHHFVADNVDVDQCFPYTTSGSTGEPIRFLKSIDAPHFDQAVISTIARRLGARRRCIPFRTSLVLVIQTPHPRSQLQPALGYSRGYRMGLDAPAWRHPEDPLRFLSARPGLILASNPHMLLELRHRSLELDPEGRYPIRPAFVLSSGGPLTPATRAVLGEFFDCRVTDVYVTEELGVVAVECPLGGSFHVEAPGCFVESLRKDGSAAEPGETGDLVVTALRSRSFPFIRYRIGDAGSLLETRCDCRSVFPKITRLVGRGGCVFPRRQGPPVTPAVLGHLLVGLPLLQFQIEQTDVDCFVFRYLAAPGAGEEAVAPPVREIFQKTFGVDVRLTLVACEKLGEPDRKPLPYISRVPSPGS